jgi:hypothetical protein
MVNIRQNYSLTVDSPASGFYYAYVAPFFHGCALLILKKMSAKAASALRFGCDRKSNGL